MIKIDKRKAIELLEAAVAERGADYVYGDHFNECLYASYVEDRAVPVPSCIVGVAMNKLGIPADRLVDIYGTVPEVSGDFENEVGILLSENAIKVFRAAQIIQDASLSGSLYDDVHEKSTKVVKAEQTWGKALEAAKAVAGV